jgi:hypothetical protein
MSAACCRLNVGEKLHSDLLAVGEHYCLHLVRQNEGSSECGFGSLQGSQTNSCAMNGRDTLEYSLRGPGPAGRRRGDSSVSRRSEYHNDASSATLVSCAQASASTLTSQFRSVVRDTYLLGSAGFLATNTSQFYFVRLSNFTSFIPFFGPHPPS